MRNGRLRISHIEFRVPGHSIGVRGALLCSSWWLYLAFIYDPLYTKRNCLHSARTRGKAKKMELSSHVFGKKRKSLSMFFFHYSAALGIILDLVFVSCICGAQNGRRCQHVRTAISHTNRRMECWNGKSEIDDWQNYEPAHSSERSSGKNPHKFVCVSVFAP